MQRQGTNVALTTEPLDNDVGYADNTMVWIPQGVPTSAPTNDITYAVTLSGVRISGSSPVMTMQLRKGELRLSFFSTFTTLAMPTDAALQKLKIECFYPADSATAEKARDLAV
jgi:hypothetical protein